MDPDVIDHLRRCRTCCGTFNSPQEKLQISTFISDLYKQITNIDLLATESFSKNICMQCFVSLSKSVTFKNKLFTSRSKIGHFVDYGYQELKKSEVQPVAFDLATPSTSTVGILDSSVDMTKTDVVNESSEHNLSVSRITPHSSMTTVPPPSSPTVAMSDDDSSSLESLTDNSFDSLRYDIDTEPVNAQANIPVVVAQANIPVEEPQANIPVVGAQANIPVTPVFINCLRCDMIVDEREIYHHLAIHHLPKVNVKRLRQRIYPQYVCKKCYELFKTKAMLIKHLEATIPCCGG